MVSSILRYKTIMHKAKSLSQHDNSKNTACTAVWGDDSRLHDLAFLSAQWRRLVMINYRMDPDVLKPYLPAFTELDIWNDTCYASLVGFRFLNTRLKGWRMPWHEHFTEINLRFYVRRHDPVLGWKRGVVFISANWLPLPAIAWVWRTLPCTDGTLRRTHPCATTGRNKRIFLQVEYAWKENSRWHSFSLGVR